MDHNYSIQRRFHNCSYCGLQFKHTKNLKVHERKKHNDFSKKTFKCIFCNVQFGYINLLKIHKAKVHNVKPIYRSRQNRSYFKCSHCPIQFKKENNLIRHEKQTHYVQHTNNVFKCKQCDSWFISSEHLQAHEVENHTTKTEVYVTSRTKTGLRNHNAGLKYILNRESKCDQCDSQFHDLRNLRVHERKKHFLKIPTDLAKKKKFECEYCGSQFNYIKNLRTHAAKKHSSIISTEKYESKLDVSLNKKFKCEHCNSQFNYKKNLKVHMVKRHKLDVSLNKKFKCEHCNSQFNYIKNLKVHMVKKHNVTVTTKYSKLFSCEQCGTQFNYLKNLRAHQAKKHNFTLTRYSKNFECTECSAKYSRKNHLQSHVKKKHREEQQNLLFYNCALCSFAASKVDLLHHFAHVHNIEIEIHRKTFQDLAEFERWKRQEERESLTSFTKDRGQRNTSASGGKIFYGYYNCHRSGYYTPRGHSLRRLKSQGSKKIGGYCPASMKVVCPENGPCKLEYTKTHVGHDNDLRHLFLNKEEKEILASQLAVKKPFEEILQDVRNSVTESERLHLVCKKDLHNINKTFKLGTCNQQVLDETGTIHVVGLDFIVSDISGGNKYVQLYEPQKVEEEPCELNESRPIGETIFCSLISDGNDSILVNDISDSQIQYDQTEVLKVPPLVSTTPTQSVSPKRLDELKNNFLEMIDSVSNAGELSAIENGYKTLKSKLNSLRSYGKVPESSPIICTPEETPHIGTVFLHNLVDQLGITSAESDHPQLK